MAFVERRDGLSHREEHGQCSTAACRETMTWNFGDILDAVAPVMPPERRR